MQARFYAPWYGRFLSPDPARDQHFEQTQSWNIYSYVQNMPTMRIDPTGMVAGEPDEQQKPTPSKDDFASATAATGDPGKRPAQTYQSESSAAVKSAMDGDLKGYFNHLGSAWKLALTDPEWLATAAIATAAPFMIEGRAVNAAHVDEMAANGVKFSEQNLVATGKMPGGKVVFLESGTSESGLQHIMERHAQDFVNKGIPESQIPRTVMDSVTKGQVVGTNGGSPVYRVKVNGVTQYIKTTVGSNGYIVQSNPVSTWKPVPLN